MKSSTQKIIDQAKGTLNGNLKTGYSDWANTKYKYICPSKSHYQHQWFWDSCFHAIALSHLDLELAKNEVNSLLWAQRKDGFIPHIIYWDRRNYNSLLTNLGSRLESKLSFTPKSTELIQPPLIAQAVEAIYQKDKNIDFLHKVLPKLKSYYLWLANNRDPDNDGLISIIAPYESGLDQSPSYDPIFGTENKPQIFSAVVGRTITFRNMMRNYNLESIFEADYFNVKDVLVNSIYIKNLETLSNLLHEIDQEESARHFHQLSLKGKDALIKKCFDRSESIFFDTYGSSDKTVKVKTIKGLLPLMLDLPKGMVGDIVKKHILNRKEFDLPYPIPTVAADEESFSPVPTKIANYPLLCRGPTWINTNWYIFNGLKKHGYEKEADNLREKTIQLIQKSGFREFFNPFSGEGYGAVDFSWSTLVVDMILR
ncbi:MAG: hypothetical protein A2Z11_02105 [Candidatus Woykebacteria bacterium RBG_16_43_9]|uniref:Mannosylglycerate hydrolase MGH1-like glycoside hydrolase domain-containing protein n=1 Tax=Candidatus Woykebacteria bacterium RBG_16_43_9 TaxID=1802596 RepID=A0A1G1WHM5_9BACT|nr:MAG: hypothetical protein A2Z11_02105 [Candidatus Woykebacteria bacterium RBG_16_43_9]